MRNPPGVAWQRRIEARAMKAKKVRRSNRVASNDGLDLRAVRTAVADYMYSEGCSCCRDTEAHEQHTNALGRMLKVQKYDDGSGYNFSKYRTKKSN